VFETGGCDSKVERFFKLWIVGAQAIDQSGSKGITAANPIDDMGEIERWAGEKSSSCHRTPDQMLWLAETELRKVMAIVFNDGKRLTIHRKHRVLSRLNLSRDYIGPRSSDSEDFLGVLLHCRWQYRTIAPTRA